MPTNDADRSARLLFDAPAPLARLELTNHELAALRRQGHVKLVLRGRGGPSYRLCFRLDGRQVSRSLGRDADRAAAVERELKRLQAPRRFRQACAASLKHTRANVRACKKKVAAELSAYGLHFHGNRLRLRREAAQHKNQPLVSV